ADPAYDPMLIAVGAADTMGTASMSDDEPASFSAAARACKPWNCRPPTLLAPGTHMQGLRVPGSYIDQNNPDAALGDLYFRGSGTSEAAAYVSGAVALLLQKYPLLTPDGVRELLASGTERLRGVSSLWQGQGELDLNKLLEAGESYGGGHGGHDALGGPGGFPSCRLGHNRAHPCPWSTGTGSLELSR